MIKHYLPHTQFDKISDHKHHMYLHGKLSTKLLAQANDKDNKLIFKKTGWLLFS